MGTRSLIAVRFGGEYRVAQYCQWDGYPEGQGVGVLGFLKDEAMVDCFRENINKTRFLDPDNTDKKFVDEYNNNAPTWSNDPDNRTEDQKHWFETYATRDLGCEVLSNIAQSDDDEILLHNAISFAGNSLFCEWGYVIDFDRNTFEVFRGFNKERVDEGRFLSEDPVLEKSDGYEPIVLIKEYPLSSLPSEEQFLADFANNEEEE